MFSFKRGENIQINPVVITQPHTIFTSSRVPSPSSLGILVAFARGGGSESFGGRNTVWTASSVVFCVLIIQFCSPTLQ